MVYIISDYAKIVSLFQRLCYDMIMFQIWKGLAKCVAEIQMFKKPCFKALFK